MLDFASAGLYSANGDTSRAYEHLISGVTSRDYVRDVALGVAGAAVSAANVPRPATQGANSSGSNIVYRALTPADAASIEAGTGLAAKAPNGTWTAAEHVANAGPGAGGAATNSPWISTTRLLDVAKGYEGGNGIVGIDLSKVGSFQAEVWQTAPRVNGVAGLPYHRSIWAQEVTIFQEIPQSAIIKVPGKK